MLQQNTEMKKWEEIYMKHTFIIIHEIDSFVVGLKY